MQIARWSLLSSLDTTTKLRLLDLIEDDDPMLVVLMQLIELCLPCTPAMHTSIQDKVLAKLARIKGVILKGQPDSTGRFAVQIGQISAAAALATGKFRKTAFSILLGPEAIARAFRSPTIAGLITEGLKINPATKQGLRQLTLFTTRLAAQLKKEDIKHEIIQPTIQELFGSEEQVNSFRGIE